MTARKILGIIVNLIAVAASIVGFVIIRSDLAKNLVLFIKYFTLVTNTLIIIFGLISIGYYIDSIIKKDKEHPLPNGLFALKNIVSVCALVTFLTVVCYLQHTVPELKDPSNSAFWNNIFHHYVAPLAFVCGLIFFDLDKKYPFKLSVFGFAVVVIYMAYAFPISNIGPEWWGQPQYPYAFMEYSKMTWKLFIIAPAFLLGSVAIGMIVWLLNRICYLIFIGEEVKEEEITEEEKEIEAQVEVTEEDKEEVNAVIKTGYNGPRIYHVSKREDGRWQVKFANGKKAIKLFRTQAEAIVFAKKLAKSQYGSIRVHSVKGTIRKA